MVVEKLKIKSNKLKEPRFVQMTVFAYPNPVGFYMVQLFLRPHCFSREFFLPDSVIALGRKCFCML